ncbi:MAG: class I SAM-dependent methyltransferase [Gammaproteobacteria bacterium]|nr:MAG: class I SAM-dependent methyltransferase [Gammaproteobacteria bacterium]
MKENSITPSEYSLPTEARMTRLQEFARRAMLRRLERIEHGRLEIIEDGTPMQFGDATGDETLRARVTVHDSRFWADVALGGNTGAGDAYIKGRWSCDNLTAAVRILLLNRDVLLSLDDGAGWLTQPLHRLLHWIHRNSRDGSRKNIAAHYDLGNDLFEEFLDPTMNYSCGIFPSKSASMEEASLEKMEAICRKLELTPDDHVLEIGTGWGGMAIHAAERYGCRVTTTTISRRQYELAAERVAAAGLDDRVTLLLEDYRDLRGEYDKLVSVEMIEAVGHQYLDTYFSTCSKLLKPEGMMLLQAITIRDQLYEDAVSSVDFIKKYIFPGGFIPSVNAISDSLTRSTDLRMFHLQDIGPHYATTLRRWRERFFENIATVRRLGYPESFVRMWDFYLCYCEGGFLERNIGNIQLLLAKPMNRRESLGYA